MDQIATHFTIRIAITKFSMNLYLRFFCFIYIYFVFGDENPPYNNGKIYKIFYNYSFNIFSLHKFLF